MNKCTFPANRDRIKTGKKRGKAAECACGKSGAVTKKILPFGRTGEFRNRKKSVVIDIQQSRITDEHLFTTINRQWFFAFFQRRLPLLVFVGKTDIGKIAPGAF